MGGGEAYGTQGEYMWDMALQRVCGVLFLEVRRLLMFE